MKYTFTLILLLFIGVSAFAQDTKFTDSSESDPKAKAILDKVKKRYVEHVVDALLSGKSPDTTTTKTIGCSIKTL